MRRAPQLLVRVVFDALENLPRSTTHRLIVGDGCGLGSLLLHAWQLDAEYPVAASGLALLTGTGDEYHGSRVIPHAQYRQRCSMPVLVIAVVFFAIFLVMGVMGVTAMVAEHRGKLFSWKWSDEPKPSKQ